MNAYNPDTEELEHLAGDQPNPEMYQTAQHADPMGTGRMGHASQMDLSRGALAHPMVRYKDFVLEVDVYAVPGTDELSIVLLCPRCRNALKVSSLKKHIEFERPSQRFPQGVLSIEPFGCTWELENDGRRMEFGLGMCNWTVAIDKNIAKDA